MKFDMMVGAMTWTQSGELARQLEAQGFDGILFTETGQTPWITIAAAAMAAEKLEFSTGIAVAFPRSPMISAQIAWELAGNTQGRFRLGLGSQVKGHVVRRYSAQFDKPAPQMRDYIGAVQASLRAFRGEEKLSHEGPYYNLSYLPENLDFINVKFLGLYWSRNNQSCFTINFSPFIQTTIQIVNIFENLIF